MAVARSSSGGMTQSLGKRANLGVFPIDNALYGPYSYKGLIWLNLLIYRKVGEN